MDEKKRQWLLIGTLLVLVIAFVILGARSKETPPTDPAYYAGPMMGKHNSNFYMPDHTQVPPPPGYHPTTPKKPDPKIAAVRDQL